MWLVFGHFWTTEELTWRRLPSFVQVAIRFQVRPAILFPLKGQGWKSLRGERLSYILKKGQRVDDDLDAANLIIFAFFQFQLDEQIIKALNVTSNGIK